MNNGYSYIVEFILYDRKKLSKLLEDYSSVDELLQCCYDNINQESYPADQEIYGNLLEKYFSSGYEFIPNFPNVQIGSYNAPSREELEEFIESNKKQDNLFLCGYHTYL